MPTAKAMVLPSKQYTLTRNYVGNQGGPLASVEEGIILDADLRTLKDLDFGIYHVIGDHFIYKAKHNPVLMTLPRKEYYALGRAETVRLNVKERHSDGVVVVIKKRMTK